MVLSYTVGTTTFNNICGNKFLSGRFSDTYTITRGFLKFDLSPYGLSLGDITAVELRTYHTSLVGGSNSYRVRSAKSGDVVWGTTLDANATDFGSTKAHIEQTQTISSTGWKSWTVNKNNLDLSGFTYFRMAISVENSTYTRNTVFNTQEATSNKAILRVTTVSAGGLQQVINIVCS